MFVTNDDQQDDRDVTTRIGLTQDLGANLTAYAVCYNPRGAVPTTAAKAANSSPELSPATRAKIAKVVAKRSR